jgi:lipoprotein Spr/probable lipoprotein NlpC
MLTIKRNYILWLCVLCLTVLASCASRKHTSDTKAARAADAMAKLKSKPLYRFINEWTGVRYKFGGMDKSGIDCSGFAYLLQRDIYGKTLPRISRDQANAIRKRSLNNLKEGDLIFFSFGGKAVDHVGVYLNGDFFVHASTSRGVIVDDLSLPAYQRAIVKTGTLN